MILSSKGFLDPSVVYSFFPLDDLFILIEGFLESSWWFLRRPREGFCIYMSSMTGPGALSLLSCCCRHEDRGGVLDLVGHMTLPAPHAPIYSPPFPSPAHSSLAMIAIIHPSHTLPPTGYDPSALPLCRGSAVLRFSHSLPVLILFNTRPLWVYGPYLPSF